MFGSIGKTLSKSLGGIVNPAGFSSNPDFLAFVPGIGDAMAADKQNAANIAGANTAMKFSERMSSTAYQRGMADMKAAGLNPMLAFSQGGASAPSGVTPTINASSKSGLGHAAISAGLGIQSAATAKQQADTQQAIGESSIALNKTSAAKQVADTQKAVAETKKTLAQTRYTESDTRLKDLHVKQKTKYEPYDNMANKVTKEGEKIINTLFNSLGTSAKDRKSASDFFGGAYNPLNWIPKHPKDKK